MSENPAHRLIVASRAAAGAALDLSVHAGVIHERVERGAHAEPIDRARVRTAARALERAAQLAMEVVEP